MTGPRPWTPDERIQRDDGTTARRIVVKQCCNGCGVKLGDTTEAEIVASIVGDPIDVRAECPYCGLGSVWALCRHWDDIANDTAGGAR